ncbi:MAG: hydantoinase B/oxoprolinase family protein [Dehalococcoidia bacterium]|nr:hydantoinase B/oxoprolinase family protein [Dehalococcoidia bacterium]
MSFNKRNFDPVLFEVVQNGLASLVDEMALTVMRTAYSGVVKDAMDYSTAFCDREGRVIAQGLTIVLHLGSFPDAVASVMSKFKGRIYPGDMFIMNDPYGSGGIHLPDIYVIKPVFVSATSAVPGRSKGIGRARSVGVGTDHGLHLEGFAGVVAHHTDVGGLVPGSNSTDSVDVYQEGLRIPTLKLFEQGVPVQPIFEILEKNVRLPDKVLGDLRSQIAAAAIGERGYQAMAIRHGRLEMRRYTEELLDYTERLARAEIMRIPDGTYSFTDYIDADNIENGPVVIKATLTKQGEGILVDLGGSSMQVKAGINSPLPFSKAGVYGAIRLIMDPSIPNSAGYHRPIEVRAPLGTVVNPVLPAPCGARGITGFRVMDAVLGALAQAVPEKVPADGEGGNSLVTMGGYDADGRPFAFVDFVAGARGGRPGGDGPEGVPHPGANIASIPVEIAEAGNPVRIEEYGMVQDSGGAGKFRGALSQVRRVRCLAPEAVLQLRSDKRLHPPYGLAGGSSGSPSMNIFTTAGGDRTLRTMTQLPVRRNEMISHFLAGGGGWGDPLDRDPELVVEDIRNEKVSTAHARAAYGVVVESGTFKLKAGETQRLRSKMRKTGLQKQADTRQTVVKKTGARAARGTGQGT